MSTKNIQYPRVGYTDSAISFVAKDGQIAEGRYALTVITVRDDSVAFKLEPSPTGMLLGYCTDQQKRRTGNSQLQFRQDAIAAPIPKGLQHFSMSPCKIVGKEIIVKKVDMAPYKRKAAFKRNGAAHKSATPATSLDALRQAIATVNTARRALGKDCALSFDKGGNLKFIFEV